MINKKIIPGIIISLLIIFFGFIKINIITTKALSPIGNSESNYEKIKKEFGHEFEEFIKDDSFIKIYDNRESEDRFTVKVGDIEFLVKDTNVVIEKFQEYYTYFITGYGIAKENVEEKLAFINKNKEEKLEEKDEEKVEDIIEENEKEINVNSEIIKEENEVKKSDEKSNKLDEIIEGFIKKKQ